MGYYGYQADTYYGKARIEFNKEAEKNSRLDSLLNVRKSTAIQFSELFPLSNVHKKYPQLDKLYFKIEDGYHPLEDIEPQLDRRYKIIEQLDDEIGIELQKNKDYSKYQKKANESFAKAFWPLL